MKKITTILLLLVLAAFWSNYSQAENVTYFAPDGRKITKAEYERLVSTQAEASQNPQNATRFQPSKKSSRLTAASGIPAAAIKADNSNPAQPKALPKGKISEICDSDVRQINKKMLEAANKRNPQGLIALLAPSYKIMLKSPEGELGLTRDEYLAYLEGGWEGFGFYRARYEGENIIITPDKQKAILEADLIEVASLIDGTTIRLRSHQKSTFEIVDGKVLITGTEALVKGL